MKTLQSNQSRKRPVKLAPNEELVPHAKGMADNLSGGQQATIDRFRDEGERRAAGKSGSFR